MRKGLATSTSTFPKAHLREDDTVLVGEDHTALLGHVVVQSRRVDDPCQVYDVDGLLPIHESKVVQVVVGYHAAGNGFKVLSSALNVPCVERPVWGYRRGVSEAFLWQLTGIEVKEIVRDGQS